ncbi:MULTISPECIES: lytic transglycosylase domain-containing protein [Rhizobium/Agrobacterium group]|uniref:Transglycosylase-like protein with SLT domain n=1 Tax=Rhizobium subbaraonis TaxID=908946 RepID=A0A285UYP8_9HYPH|nr:MULTISPECIES: lytic transglycosylase domain-containing protein [Rhizobium/Agrobacterium group]WLS06939.1 lytic transglycosylase domain-containing protein [Shinella sumterensis]MDH0871684.1 lytic transglycosylase domain-containing protein [Agrobacterium pusense]TQN62491.1 lytic transglycosylase domain-containing protein [Agrobacterium tumefaciens]CDN94533.1 Lytic transglycosylase, catalytic [Agrobacterium tumefaciens]SOC46940.1 transglycosylase-like protein with SLT domain [Rhizobium subbara
MTAVKHRASVGGLIAVRRSALLLLLSGLTFTAAETPAILAQVPSPVRAASAHPHAAHIAEASRRFGIPSTWIVAVMRTESAGDVRAVSSAGAMGLMQVMPDTWAELRLRYRLGRNPYNSRDNILAGTAYLREMWDRYGDVAAMLAAYNAGPARYDEHRSKGRPLPAETRAYVTFLAPVLRGERPSKSGSAIARPLDWREAAIFVGRDDGASAGNPASSDRALTDTRSPVQAAQETLTAAQPKGLFIARAAAGDRP